MLYLTGLDLEQCERLLRGGAVGRVALAAPDGPHIVGVSYVVLDRTIVVRTSPHSVLGTYGRDAVVAFEVDRVRHDRDEDQHQGPRQGQHQGWTVTARGRATSLDAGTTARVRTSGAARSWVTGARSGLLQIHWTELTGRRLAVPARREGTAAPQTGQGDSPTRDLGP